MKILLSPAKSLNEQCEYPDLEFTTPAFSKEAKQLAGKLKKLSKKKVMDLMHVSAPIAELNVNRFKNWYLDDKPTEEVKPAGFLFNGDVYRGLDFTTLTPAQQHRAQEELRFLSGMYGILKPFDLMFPYRLEMGTKFKTSEKAGNLYEFWGKKLTTFLEKETDKDELIVNLASQEYAKAVNWKAIKRNHVTPVFKELKDGEYKIVAIFAKLARGAMARYLIQHDIHTAQGIKGFDIDGYKFIESESTENELVFAR